MLAVHMPALGEPAPLYSRQGRELQRYSINGERLVAGWGFGSVVAPARCAAAMLPHLAAYLLLDFLSASNKTFLVASQSVCCCNHFARGSPSTLLRVVLSGASRYVFGVRSRARLPWRFCSSPAVLARVTYFPRWATACKEVAGAYFLLTLVSTF